MLPPSQIQRTLNDPGARERIVEILAREEFTSRSALGRRVCEEFGFADNRGRWQLAGCLKALSVLAAASDDMVLPARQGVPIRSTPIRLDGAVAPAVDVPARVEAVRALSVVLVAGREHRRIWNTLIAEKPDFRKVEEDARKARRAVSRRGLRANGAIGKGNPA